MPGAMKRGHPPDHGGALEKVTGACLLQCQQSSPWVLVFSTRVDRTRTNKAPEKRACASIISGLSFFVERCNSGRRSMNRITTKTVEAKMRPEIEQHECEYRSWHRILPRCAGYWFARKLMDSIGLSASKARAVHAAIYGCSAMRLGPQGCFQRIARCRRHHHRRQMMMKVTTKT
jgi:hypothetical protein